MSNSINIESLRKLSGEDDDFVIEILNLYIKSTPKLLEDLRSHLKCNNKDLLLQSLHKLKSSSLSLGLTEIKEEITQVETLTKTSDLSKIYDSVLKLVAEVEKVIATAEKQIKELDD